MNQTFNNITISGKIYFSDGTIFDGTKVTSLANIAAFERNSILETTSILQDDLIVNKKIVTAESISAPSVLSNAISFTNDLDPSGVPIVQSIGFTGQLRDKINQFQETFNDIIPDIIEPPTKKAKLNSAEFISTNFATSINDQSIYIESTNSPLQIQLEPNLIGLRNTLADTANFSIDDTTGNLEISSSKNIIDLQQNEIQNIRSMTGSTTGPLKFSSLNNPIEFYTNGVYRGAFDQLGNLSFPNCNINGTTGIITATFNGNANSANLINCLEENSSTVSYLTMTQGAGSGQKQLLIDSTTTPLSYVPSTSTLTASNFNGTALNSTNLLCTSDNTSGTYYIPFVKSNGTNQKPFFIDDVTGPLTYNASTSTLTCTNFAGTALNTTNVNVVTTNTTNTNYSVNFSTASGNTQIRSDTNLLYNPSTNTLAGVVINADTSFNGPLLQNLTGNVELKCSVTGVGGNIILTGGTGLLSTTAGANSGQHLVITVNGTQYKIQLLNV